RVLQDRAYVGARLLLADAKNELGSGKKGVGLGNFKEGQINFNKLWAEKLSDRVIAIGSPLDMFTHLSGSKTFFSGTLAPYKDIIKDLTGRDLQSAVEQRTPVYDLKNNRIVMKNYLVDSTGKPLVDGDLSKKTMHVITDKQDFYDKIEKFDNGKNNKVLIPITERDIDRVFAELNSKYKDKKILKIDSSNIKTPKIKDLLDKGDVFKNYDVVLIGEVAFEGTNSFKNAKSLVFYDAHFHPQYLATQGISRILRGSKDAEKDVSVYVEGIDKHLDSYAKHNPDKLKSSIKEALLKDTSKDLGEIISGLTVKEKVMVSFKFNEKAYVSEITRDFGRRQQEKLVLDTWDSFRGNILKKYNYDMNNEKVKWLEDFTQKEVYNRRSGNIWVDVITSNKMMDAKDIAKREKNNAEFRLKKLYEEVESSPLGGFRSADMKIAKNILKINPTKDISYADKMIFDRQKELSDNINQNYADIGFKDFRSTSAGASDIMVRSLVKSELNKGTPSSYKDFKKNFYKIASIKETDTILKNLNSLGAFKGNVRLANIPIIGKAFNPTLNNNLIDVDDERSNLLRYALGISDDINGFIDSSTAYRLNKITTGKFNPFREGKEVFGGVKSALKHRYGILYNRFEKDDKDLSRDRVIYAGYTYDNMREQLLDASANSFSTSLSMLNEL
ncbi:MAG: hypothetical protein KAJ79_06360, partial [Candidatus Omnitrophica bacterium]|nr:hypothetical protein [Candidatus Omnitrophota bacterium]